MKRILLILVLIGIVLGVLHQQGALTGIPIIDQGVDALDTWLRGYVQTLQTYATEENGGSRAELSDVRRALATPAVRSMSTPSAESDPAVEDLLPGAEEGTTVLP